MVNIAVQPPTQTSVNAMLYPPPVVRTRVHSSSPYSESGHLYATAYVIDVATSEIVWQEAFVNPKELFDSRRTWSYFDFWNLSIPYAGNFIVRVDIFVIDSIEGAFHVLEQAYTTAIEVLDEEVSASQPTPNEQVLLSSLEAANHAS